MWTMWRRATCWRWTGAASARITFWAAAALIATEAGAVLVMPEPDEEDRAGLLVAAAPGIAAQLLDALDRCGGLAPLD